MRPGDLNPQNVNVTEGTPAFAKGNPIPKKKRIQ